MKNKFIIIAIILIAAIFFYNNNKEENLIETVAEKKRVWQVKSVDTMKYSRDLTAEKISDQSFDEIIKNQVESIENLNATHVAVGTPYDEKFTPFLKRWVDTTRENNLNVWFRGNFSSWQGWFGFPKNLTREEHIRLSREFIRNNPDLFRDGDVFSPCPECENGGPGDPRITRDVEEYRKFLIDERNAAIEEFRKIKKEVLVIDSMNYDVAQLIMNQETAQKLGGIVVIDHYVKTPQKLAEDITKISKKANASVILGEFGAPIPDIHGKLTEDEQAAWIEEALSLTKDKEELIGINYWVSYGGSTEIFNDNYTAKQAATVLKTFFSLTNLD